MLYICPKQKFSFSPAQFAFHTFQPQNVCIIRFTYLFLDTVPVFLHFGLNQLLDVNEKAQTIKTISWLTYVSQMQKSSLSKTDITLSMEPIPV